MGREVVPAEQLREPILQLLDAEDPHTLTLTDIAGALEVQWGPAWEQIDHAQVTLALEGLVSMGMAQRITHRRDKSPWRNRYRRAHAVQRSLF